jgi:uncharacterized protein (TIGR03083 family)
VDTREHLDAIRIESGRFAKAARGPLETRVPSCPEWSLGDLVWHLGGVQRFWAEVVRTQTMDRATIEPPAAVPDDELLAWFEDVSAELLHTLETTDPAVRVWSWAGGQQDVAWVRRRQAHEAAVHRWDAQNAVGRAKPIAPALARDGIEEYFAWMLDPEEAERFEGTVVIRLAPTDADAAWLVAVRDGRVTLSSDDIAVDITVRATASDLLLLLWRRVGTDDVDVEGERSSLDRFLAISDLT